MKNAFIRFVGLILCVAAVPKLRHPDAFFTSLHGYALFPQPALVPLTSLVPALEVIVGLALILRLSRAGQLWAALLFGGFTGALSWARWHNLALTCGCFGRIDGGLHRLPHGLDLHILGTLAITVALIFIRTVPGSLQLPGQNAKLSGGQTPQEVVMSDTNPPQQGFIDPNLYKKHIQIDDGPEIKGNSPKDVKKPQPVDPDRKY